MAQENEMNKLKKKYDQIVARWPKAQVIMVGLSCGASTIFNLLASHHRIPNVVAVVLESPFDSFAGVVEDMFKEYPWVRSAVLTLIDYGIPFFKYCSDGPQPIKQASQYPHDIPTLILYAEGDRTVPASSTERLINELQTTNHVNIATFKLTAGNHAQLINGPQGILFENRVHQFFKECGLPYNTKRNLKV
jgi:alpha-beta hydrolase superfamily lysophospholipase